MKTPLTFEIYSTTKELPITWDTIAKDNIFLTNSYLEILEKAAPKNMTCFFIGLFKNEILVGIALAQFLDLNKLESFGERDKCIKTMIRNFAFKNFSSHVLFIGNNMLTGQNAYVFCNDVNKFQALKTVHQAANSLKNQLKTKGKRVHILTFKDFYEDNLENFNLLEFNNFYKFSTQPNMVFSVADNWKTEDDYINSLSKKYRDQYKRSRKKGEGIKKKRMNLNDIIANETVIYELYFHVAKNAPFNTFFLPKNHFRVFKELMHDKFLFYGYFLNEKLIGFNTLIKNGKVLDTYFLGYDDTLQREKMLYLNMLYDMIFYAIKKDFKEIIFARTALEIKSSVGAKPIETFGFISHSNSLINRKMSKLFNYLEPKTIWQERNPFK
ncbi:8-amino-7-oxononanoate synthase [Flavobacterium luteum]|uniref:8-amino-7-oxononanoate synthase n=1 Tax=Flavobacterium luteum TaxID=2026654 RepID=A0A7J5AGC2_9FLAO|nr:8-amino-7-oxononanoate synthase [Flavobacterium luteum]KAB1156646.1 8-amino-7-oxononanoate synthase [Flavobacterium luteum]